MLYVPEKYGGTGCFDIRLKRKSLKIKWFVKILQQELACNALSLGQFFLNNFDKTLKGLGLNALTISLRNVQNNSTPVVYQGIVKACAWQELRYSRKMPERRDLILEEFLLLNQLVNNNANVLYDLAWIQKGA